MTPQPPSPTTHLTLVLDRSGSIGGLRDEIVAGVNRFLAEQARLPGRVRVTLLRFNTETETVWDNLPLPETGPLALSALIPQGGTALHDATGRAIEETAARVDVAHRPGPPGSPGPVIIAIFTDGFENSSQRYSGEAIARLVQERRDRDGWQFLFFGANQDAAHEAGRLSIDPASAHGFVASREGTRDAFQALSTSVSRLRQGHADDEAPTTTSATPSASNQPRPADEPGSAIPKPGLPRQRIRSSPWRPGGRQPRPNPTPRADEPRPGVPPGQERPGSSWNFEI